MDPRPLPPPAARWPPSQCLPPPQAALRCLSSAGVTPSPKPAQSLGKGGAEEAGLRDPGLGADRPDPGMAGKRAAQQRWGAGGGQGTDHDRPRFYPAGGRAASQKRTVRRRRCGGEIKRPPVRALAGMQRAALDAVLSVCTPPSGRQGLSSEEALNKFSLTGTLPSAASRLWPQPGREASTGKWSQWLGSPHHSGRERREIKARGQAEMSPETRIPAG